MQGIIPELAGSQERSHTLFIMFIYIWCNINRNPNKFVCVWNNEAVSMAHSILMWLETQSYCVQILVGSDVTHRGCTYTVRQTVQRNKVCSDVYGTVHYKEPLKLFESRALSLHSFAILPWLCRNQRRAIFTLNNDTYIDDRYFVVWFSCVGLYPKTSMGHINV